MPESQPRNLRTVREIGRPDILFSVARIPNTSRLLLASSEGKVLELDALAQNTQAKELAQHGRYVTAVRLVGRTVLSGGYDGKLIFWDLDQNKAIRTVDAHSRWIRQIAVAPDGTRFASVGDDMVCRLWDVNSGAKLLEMRGHQELTPSHFASMLYACTFSPDGRYLATGDRVGHVVVWDVATGQQVSAFDVPVLYTWDKVQRIRSIGGIRGLAFSPDSKQLAVGGVGQINNVDSLDGPATVEIFDWANRQKLVTFTGPRGIVNRLAYHPRGQWLGAFGGGANGLVMFYDVARRTMLYQGSLAMHIHDIALGDDANTFCAVGHNKILLVENA